jgi:hypothetical protein
MDNGKPEENKLKDLPANVAVPDDAAIKGGAKQSPTASATLEEVVVQPNGGGGGYTPIKVPHPNI